MTGFTPKAGFVLDAEDAARAAYDDAVYANAPERDDYDDDGNLVSFGNTVYDEDCTP